MIEEAIHVQGAREHNLRNIDIQLPKDKLIVFTGVSGSGKSSLAIDTVYAEGQRRYIESLSAYARQFLGQLGKPDVDEIVGLSPSIAISQGSTGHNPRSTVATVTEIYDYLRVLYARVGQFHCPDCGREVGSQTAADIVNTLLDYPERTRLILLAPIARGSRGAHEKEIEDLRSAGFARLRVDGEIHEIRPGFALSRNQRHDIDLVIDRIIIKDGIEPRVTEAVNTALARGEGSMLVQVVPTEGEASPFLSEEDDLLFSRDYTCSHCRISFVKPEPRHFSFNNPDGMCENCRGLGVQMGILPQLIILDDTLSIMKGAISLWGPLNTQKRATERAIAEALAKHLEFDIKTPWKELTPEQQHAILYGTGDAVLTITTPGKNTNKRRKQRRRYRVHFHGIIPAEEQKYYFEDDDAADEDDFPDYFVKMPCRVCEGTRLNAWTKAITIQDTPITDILEKSIQEATQFFTALELPEREAFIAHELLKEIRGRLGFLMDVGLGYLTLARPAPTLSGGEAQRIRLASQVGAGLRDVTYVLDEPSIGLHPRDHAGLLTTLLNLRNQGNTVIVVEHDEATMLVADWIVDFGPGAGIKGGKITDIGTPAQFIKESKTLTAQYLRGDKVIIQPESRRPATDRWIQIRNARQNNLKEISPKIPIGTLCCVTGVSGSGKSSLIHDILYNALARDLMKAKTVPGDYDDIRGIIEEKDVPISDVIDKIININMAPIGRTPRSNAATYTKVFDGIRALYASLPDAKLRGYKPGRFSFNVAAGRCEACSGNGAKKVDMGLLSDVWVECEVCNGKRFNTETLAIKYKGKDISEVLEMDIDTALVHFADIPKIARGLKLLHDVGLDYIKLGQPAPTLSGGEAQRIKLSRELSKRGTGKTLYILDEPTTGLHFDDVKKLLEVLHQLANMGNTVIVIEHNLEVVKTADYLIDLGPEGGEEGGYVVATGTPEEVAAVEESYTGIALQPALAPRGLEGSSIDNTQYATHSPPHVLQESTAPYELTNNNEEEYISVHGAHEHNLKHINVEIPHRKFTTFTGVSGSGKSSLALDTIYAEGQRRYVESLSAYARQFLGQLEKPKVEKIEGLSPAIAIEQKAPSKNPRSTVGTVTEIYDYLRVLYARVGTAHCPQCGSEISVQSVQQIVDKIVALADGTRLYVLSPLVLRPNEDYPDAFQRLQRDGYARVEIDGEVHPIDRAPKIGKSIRHDVKIVVDRLALEPDERGRLAEAVETATQQSGGTVAVGVINEGKRAGRRSEITHHVFSEHFACVPCGLSFPELTPRHFSFNSSIGQCPACEGIGTIGHRLYTCQECEGTRIQPLARGVTLGGETIAALTAMPIGRTADFFEHLDLLKHQMEIGGTLLKEIQQRLRFLVDIGLHYLTLDRPAPSLSGGEMQRIRLASQLGSGLTGVTYILDEPSIGLHQRDQERLLNALKGLRDLGNSVLVVEHDLETMLASDHILDFGPRAGKFGGEIVAAGSPTEIQQSEQSLTGGYLTGKLKIDVPPQRRQGKGEWLEMIGVRTNNLQNVDVEIPLGTLTCVTGVSGSGKSSLIEETLYPVLVSNLNRTRMRGGKYRSIYGLDCLDKVINIDQQPIGDTPRSNPATYTDLFTKIRYLFADLPDAKVHGFDSRRFSFNQKTGQCETCRGHGFNKVEMHFLADVWVKCETCGGTGYNHETLQIYYKGKNIADILAMTVQEALEHFQSVPTIQRPLQMLYDVGLDYIELGQAATTLSGGESQRVKLARELSKRSTGKTIYIMDEPTTGLHFDDVQKLLMVLNRLVDKGNTIVIIEHNMDVIKSADWIIDLGPEGGIEGGKVVAIGTPEEVMAVEESHTGRFLRKAFTTSV
jgi:excinuclease ABC subunit A